ncbi:hypothetical protein QEV68_10635 [Trueperella pyogenes]|uniref:hypothetical protein n=1 Tax=Trueperella pyogenes TaxID=1661 RepID=UPI00324B0662
MNETYDPAYTAALAYLANVAFTADVDPTLDDIADDHYADRDTVIDHVRSLISDLGA